MKKKAGLGHDYFQIKYEGEKSLYEIDFNICPRPISSAFVTSRLVSILLELNLIVFW